MKSAANKKVRLFSVALLLIAACGWLVGRTAWADSPLRIKGKKEIFVARDKRIDHSIFSFWCGSNAIGVYYGELPGPLPREFFPPGNAGSERHLRHVRRILREYDDTWIRIELIKVPSGERIEISKNRDHHPFNCSPDGEWLVYMDTASARLDQRSRREMKEAHGSEWEFHPAWEGYVADLYRYRVPTGERQVFAAIRGHISNWQVVSPDGKRAFLGGRHYLPIEMPEPRWEALWFPEGVRDWSETGARWFRDSSGVVSYSHNPNRLYVAFFGEKGWAKQFDLENEIESNIERLSVDGEGRIYFWLAERGVVGDNKGKRFLHRCVLEIEEKALSCRIVLERNRSIRSYEILPGGDILFIEHGGKCILRIAPRRTHAVCVVDTQKDRWVYLIGISPDGKWLAYERHKDLFVISLVND
ncbi:MAG: PD40 domain-containing protein [SAR324 cluster bacterium]|nr:PD40 domain-containing protein [SAR324 cluster bacterium]